MKNNQYNDHFEKEVEKEVKFIICLFTGMLFLSVILSVAVTAKSHKEAKAILENAGQRPTEVEIEEWVEEHKSPIMTLNYRGNYFFYNTKGQVIYRPDIQRRLDELTKKAKKPRLSKIFDL
ncbi:hypothetical protein IK112_03290 [Candidatus Saccharibacteria bacterium]|nr:hypothetical protein [Candidatus Saccharibacteria bacterium]